MSCRGRCRCAFGTLLFALLLTLLGGCAMAPPPPQPIAPRPELFGRPAASPEGRTPGRVALLVEPEAAASATRMPEYLFALQSGAMVEQALRLALDAGLQGGVEVVGALPPAGSFDATLALRWVQLDFRKHPVPPATVNLAFETLLFDARGRGAWTRSYHDDQDYPLGERLFLVGPDENRRDAEVRLAHEAAWRLAQQVLRDLRAWLAAERARPREL